jgi:regulator of nucleoside diphosphate kinase
MKDKTKMNATMQLAPTTHNRTIYITDHDMDRLRDLLERAKDANPVRTDLKDLEAELDRAKLVAPHAVPEDVITMNSKVRLIDRDTAEELTYTVVFPEEANIAQAKISILAPVGTAMLGHRVGDTFEWQVPDGIVSLEVKEILYQPEAAGDFEL